MKTLSLRRLAACAALTILSGWTLAAKPEDSVTAVQSKDPVVHFLDSVASRAASVQTVLVNYQATKWQSSAQVEHGGNMTEFGGSWARNDKHQTAYRQDFVLPTGTTEHRASIVSQDLLYTAQQEGDARTFGSIRPAPRSVQGTLPWLRSSGNHSTLRSSICVSAASAVST